MVNTDPRIASYIGIARGQIPGEHYLADGAMQRAFADAPFEAAIRPLIEPEEFTAG
jgi:hypothetical protein